MPDVATSALVATIIIKNYSVRSSQQIKVAILTLIIY